jgi:vancomycin resistance protein YoaR
VIRQRVTTTLAASALLLGVLAAVLLLVVIAQQGRILPGTTVAGVDVGGLDVASARRILGPEVEAAARRPIRISMPGEQVLLDPRTVGTSVDLDRTVEAAFARGRRWTPASAGARLLSPFLVADVQLQRSVDAARVQAWVDDVADRLERDGSAGDLGIAGSDTGYRVTTFGPIGAIAVDRVGSADALRAALRAGEGRARLVTVAGLPPSDRRSIERIADDVAQALRHPMVLRHDGRILTIGPDALAEFIDVTTTTDAAGRSVPQLDVPTARVRALLGVEGRATFDREARDARFLTERSPPTTLSDLDSTAFRPVEAGVGIEAGASRVSFVPERTAAQIVSLIEERRRSAIADVDEEDPELPTAAALAGRPTHLLGTFTTFYAAGGPRTVNIRLLADILDDRVIPPGATFSVNGTSGPRRCEDGFLPAGTIIRGELVDTCGGGVSQIGTTVVNAAFFAGLTLEQWQPHSFFISRYPAGREATLSFPELDVRFTNDTEGYLVLRSSTTPESVTVTIYGIPRWQEVRADHGERRAPTDFGREERTTTDLPPGVRRVVQSGGGGFTITVTRTRVPVDATTEVSRERWTTVSRPQQRIVEVGASATPD